MFIKWHGYSCFEFADDESRVVVDPHDGKSIGIYPPSAKADVVLCTHNHYDRNAFRVIGGHHKDFTEATGDHECGSFVFTGLPSFADTSMGAERGPNSVYMFSMDGIKIAFCGALGDIPTMRAVDRINGADILFVPVGEFGTLRMDKVNELLRMARVRTVVPTDYRVGGITLPLSPLSAFVEGKDPDDFVHVGNEIDVMPDDLTDFTGYWVFDR